MHFQASKHTKLLLFSLFLLHFHNPISAEDWNFFKCYNSSNYTSGSQYETNVKTILSSLSSNGVLRKESFYSTTYGDGPNTIYGFSQCMSAASEMSVGSASSIQQPRYSNESFFSQLDSDIRVTDYPLQNVSERVLFYTQMGSLMYDLSLTAASAASKYAVKVMTSSDFQNIYGLAQCTRDLSNSSCYNCLTNMLYEIRSCCDGRTGGSVYSVSCNIRCEVYSFFTLPSEGAENNQIVNFSKKRISLLAIVLPLAISGILMMVSMGYFLWKRFKRKDKSPFCSSRRRKRTNRAVEPKACNTLKCEEDIVELPLYTFSSIIAATNNFSTENKLGEGGFGKVYKGKLNQGMEIAVKRLSKSSVQGEEEFKNEIQLIAKLQHKNLVRLLGLCVHREEKILI